MRETPFQIARISRRLLISLVAVVLLVGTAPAFVVADEVNGDTELCVTRDEDGTFRVHGEFTVLAPRPVAWAVLTDYANLPAFVSSLRSSVVTARDTDSITVAQLGVGKVGPFTRSVRVTLAVVETRPYRIDFRDLSGETFASYAGTWDIAAIPGGVRVLYNVLVLPRTAPPLFGRTIVGRNARNLLDQVRLEMVRRSVRTAAAE